MGKSPHIYFILGLLLCNMAFSQQREFITGRLLDATTEEPIVFASIRIKDRSLGVISNLDGDFKIPLVYKTYGDILEISSMGYESKEFQIQELSEDTVHLLTLEPAVFGLSETVVTAKKRKAGNLSAKQIVRRAIKAIPDNFPIAPFSVVGYYRDYQRDDRSYVNLNESILEVFDNGFGTMDSVTTKVRLFENVMNFDFKRDTMAQQPYEYDFRLGRKVVDQAFLSAYGGNEFTILRVHDAIRNYDISSYSFIYRLKKDVLTEHIFTKVTDTYLNGMPLYTVRFKKLLPNFSAYGTFYISKDDFAIHKLEYAAYFHTGPIPENDSENKRADRKLIFEITTEYQPQFGKMYLNYISFHNTFQLWDAPKFVMEYALVDAPDGVFRLVFNKKPNLNSAREKNNIEIQYNEKQLKLGNILRDSTDSEEKTLLVYPDINTYKAQSMFGHLAKFDYKKSVDSTLIAIKLQNLKDTEGNVINQWTSRDYNQFREFFVQEIKPEAIVPSDTLFMDKRKPMFADQPVIKPDNFDDYWMNTPLKTLNK